jgi:hypothetical protein
VFAEVIERMVICQVRGTNIQVTYVLLYFNKCVPYVVEVMLTPSYLKFILVNW